VSRHRNDLRRAYPQRPPAIIQDRDGEHCDERSEVNDEPEALEGMIARLAPLADDGPARDPCEDDGEIDCRDIPFRLSAFAPGESEDRKHERDLDQKPDHRSRRWPFASAQASHAAMFVAYSAEVNASSGQVGSSPAPVSIAILRN